MKHTAQHLGKSQHGVYAVEWAIVFPVFFMLLYALLSYSLAFLVRESMQLAVEDGARAALQYQHTRTQRLDNARSVVQQRLSWLPVSLRPSASAIQVTLCRLANGEACAVDLLCGAETTNRCFVRVQLDIGYGQHPLAPAIPYLGVLVPQTLTASASVLADTGGL